MPGRTTASGHDRRDQHPRLRGKPLWLVEILYSLSEEGLLRPDGNTRGRPGSPTACVELLRRAESLLPGGHPDAGLVSVELVEALLRGG